MPSTTRLAYDVSTGEHVLLSKDNTPTNKVFSEKMLAQEHQREKRLARKQRQRARRREEKCSQLSPDTHSTQENITMLERVSIPVSLAILQPATEQLHTMRSQIMANLRDVCFSLLYCTHPTQRAVDEALDGYAKRLQRATEEWVAAMVLFRRALRTEQVTLPGDIIDVVKHTNSLIGSTDNVLEPLYAASLAAWRKQLYEVLGV